MNIKIVVIAFIVFAGSVGHMQAMGQRDGGGGDAFAAANPERSGRTSYGMIGSHGVTAVMIAVQEIKAMDKRANRGWKGLSNLSQPTSRNPVTPPYAYWPKDSDDCLRDILRNLPEFGGPADARDLLYQEYRNTPGHSLFSDYNSQMIHMMDDVLRFLQNNH